LKKKGEQQQQQQHIFVVELVREPIIHQPRGPNLTLFYLLPTNYFPSLEHYVGLGWGGGDGTKNDFGNSKKAKAKTQQRKSH
jgi:hypothetical protein